MNSGYLSQVAFWVLGLAMIGNVVGVVIRIMTRPRHGTRREP